MILTKIQNYLYQDNYNLIPEDLILEIRKCLKKHLDGEDLFKIDVELIAKLIHLNTTDPFIKQENISSLLSISKDNLIFYNSILRKVTEFQRYLTDLGVASKFFKNTIFPVIQSGSLDSYSRKKTIFPFKVGLFPGFLACLNVHFCGRNYDAVYDRSKLDQGMQMFKKLISEAQKMMIIDFISREVWSHLLIQI